MIFDGSNGKVVVDDTGIRITRKGIANFLTQGLQGEKFIPFDSIRAVQFKEAGRWMAGFIQFSTVGSIDRPGGMLAATKDENAVLFESSQQPDFERLRKILEDKIRKRSETPTVPDGSIVEELERLAALMDRGLLTREEFDARKASLLSK
ncbi:MAG: SHOCT domain-containing protein [Pseudorhodobacter sp.]|nr:SHOCT domain-containing protein [Pseudorhodobacter sp.]